MWISQVQKREMADMSQGQQTSHVPQWAWYQWVLAIATVIVACVMVWQGIQFAGVPDPFVHGLHPSAVVVNTSLIVFREGLEAILVLAAITASFVGAQSMLRRSVFAGAGWALVASLVTWFIVVAIIDRIDAPLLHIQAATGLLAIVVLLVIMNWFLHNVYWTGWIAMHTQKKRTLLAGDITAQATVWGLAMLGFSAVYREGFEIVLFLQNVRLAMGTPTVLAGVLIGLAFTGTIGVVTFVTNHKMPYKQLLIATGLLLAMVLVVMVGEEVQEMQQAGWLGTTVVPVDMPGWLGMWFAVFPNIEGLLAQMSALVLVIGSYLLSQRIVTMRHRG
jgi:high-affinity iron transporter